MVKHDNPNQPEAWIGAHSLTYRRGRATVLRDVSFTMRPGRHYVVLGPNGAGKTTLLDHLARLKSPASGSLTVMGRPPNAYRVTDYARLVALAPQASRMAFSFTVREAVAMGRRPYLDGWGRLGREDWRQVDGALRDAQLAELADRPATALSGGEGRRTVIARALAQATPILLLDEPDSGLDIAQALSVMTVARRLARAGSLVVTVTHDLNLAARFAQEMLFLKDGAVVAQGPVETVFTREILSRVYDCPARISRNGEDGAPAVHFNLPDRAAARPGVPGNAEMGEMAIDNPAGMT